MRGNASIFAIVADRPWFDPLTSGEGHPPLLVPLSWQRRAWWRDAPRPLPRGPLTPDSCRDPVNVIVCDGELICRVGKRHADSGHVMHVNAGVPVIVEH